MLSTSKLRKYSQKNGRHSGLKMGGINPDIWALAKRSVNRSQRGKMKGKRAAQLQEKEGMSR